METIGSVLTSESFLSHIPGIIALIFAISVAIKAGVIRVKTSHVTIGAEKRDAFYERTIVRNQIQAAHDFILSLEQKINLLMPEGLEYGGYKTKYILELVYDKVVDWITFNHLENSDAYLNCKYKELDNLIYQNMPAEPFKTPEFQDRVHRWVKELIIQMIEVRELYKKQLEAR